MREGYSPPPERATSEGQNGTLEDRVGYQFGRTAASSDQKWLRDAAVYHAKIALVGRVQPPASHAQHHSAAMYGRFPSAPLSRPPRYYSTLS